MDLDGILDDAAARDWTTDVDGTLRIAVIGLGWFGPDVGLPAIADSEHCEATVAVSGSRGKAERVAAEHDLARGITYEEYHDGVAAGAYDAVYVTTPNARHLPYGETAADLGKHVLVEKPMEATYERAERLAAACDDAGVTLMVAYRVQTAPLVRRARDLVRAGTIGDPVHAAGSFTFRMDVGDDPWRIDPELSGGAALLDVGVYPMNTIRFVLDDEPEAVRGRTASVHEGFEAVRDEHAAFQLEFPRGATASCHASFNAHVENRLRIVGTEGRIEMDPIYNVQVERTLEVETVDGRASVGVDVDEVVEEFDYFASAALGDLTVEPDGADGLRDMEIVEAVFESAETGSRVPL